MSNYTIYNSAKSAQYVANTQKEWSDHYKDAFLEQSHDFSQLSLLLPDDCLIMVGPPRHPDWASFNNRTIGFLRNITIGQQANLQPVKALGSRRHIWAKTNQPVTLQIQRMVFTKGTLLGTLYSIIASDKGNINKNLTYNAGKIGDIPDVYQSQGMMYTNIEDDLFRIPFGLKIFLGSPSIIANEKSVPAVLAESCVIQTHQMSITAGEALVLEDVTIYADRLVGEKRDDDNGVVTGSTEFVEPKPASAAQAESNAERINNGEMG